MHAALRTDNKSHGLEIQWRVDGAQGNVWYQRAMRAHPNCLVHVALPQTNAVSAIRSSLYPVQVACMFAMAAVIVILA